MTTLAAYTGPSPATGYVGYINFTQKGDVVVATIRPESANGDGTATLEIPTEEAVRLAQSILAATALEASAPGWRELLEIALDEYEGDKGRITDPASPHWSVKARQALALLASIGEST